LPIFLYVRAIELFLSYFRLGAGILGVYDLRMGGLKPSSPQFGKKNPVSWVGVLPGLDLKGQGRSLFSLIFATVAGTINLVCTNIGKILEFMLLFVPTLAIIRIQVTCSDKQRCFTVLRANSLSGQKNATRLLHVNAQSP